MRVVVDILLLLPAFAWQSALAGHFQVRGVGLDLLAVSCGRKVPHGQLDRADGGAFCGLCAERIGARDLSLLC